MNNEKIAILVDSGTDVPKDYVQRYGMYVAPLKIIFSDCEYTDGVDVTPELLYKRFESEIPKTSLPTGEHITALLDQIKAAGYEKVLAITISSGLSGTYNVIDLIGRQYEGLEVYAIDTLNIAIASGLIAIQAAEDIENGMTWAELTRTTDERIAKSKVYFCVKTLEYLQKGGRIGLVSSILGNALNLKPIISCNDDGIYYVAAKVRGRKQSLQKAMELTYQFAKSHKHYALAIMHSNAEEEAEAVRQELLKLLPEPHLVITGQISPTLIVHTGPGLIGIGVHILD